MPDSIRLIKVSLCHQQPGAHRLAYSPSKRLIVWCGVCVCVESSAEHIFHAAGRICLPDSSSRDTNTGRIEQRTEEWFDFCSHVQKRSKKKKRSRLEV